METQRLLDLEAEHYRLFGVHSHSFVDGRRLKQNDNKNDRNNDVETKPEEEQEQEEEQEKEEEQVNEQPTIDVKTDPPAETTTDAPTEEATEESTENEDEEMLGETRIDLVKLVPFDVKLSLLMTKEDPLNTFALTDIVTAWMEESLEAQVQRMQLGLTHSAFDSVILEERGITYHTLASANDTNDGTISATTTKGAEESAPKDGPNRRQLQQPSNSIASYEGVTLWKHSTKSNKQIMTPKLLEDIERQALLRDDRLLELLQSSSAQGLGNKVQDVRAYINLNPDSYIPIQTATSTDANNSAINANLELIIVVAIVVACMAFAFLVFSLFWAWRFDQQRRDQAYRVENNNASNPNNSNNKRNKKAHADDSDEETPKNMNVLVNQEEDGISETVPTTGIYPESVVSEDISTSLSAYYRSGMGTRPLYGTSNTLGNNDFNDQASFSSMESYGYSLDGYAPSLGGNTYQTNKPPGRTTGEAEDENTTIKEP